MAMAWHVNKPPDGKNAICISGFVYSTLASFGIKSSNGFVRYLGREAPDRERSLKRCNFVPRHGVFKDVGRTNRISPMNAM